MQNARVLVISDLHVPYEHPDTVGFLSAIKDKYYPDRVISIGDEVEFHQINFHEHSPELPSADTELRRAIHHLKPIYSLWDEVDVLESNHGSMVYRRATAIGLPLRVFKSYREVLEAPLNWKWHSHLQIKLSNGQQCFFCHGKTANPLALSQTMGMNAVQGHYHEKFSINYWMSGSGVFWQLQVGCMVNDESLAFAYNKVNLKRPIIGCAIIIDGHPHLLPMILNWKNRWTGKLL